MTKPILSICQSCRLSEQDDDNQPSDGALLFNQLIVLHQQWPRQSELDIRPVNCLWICRQPCAVVLQSSNKCTYLFTDLPSSDSAEALITFSEHYLNSKNGNLPWQKFPEVLKTRTIARIPLADQDMENED